MLKSKILTGCAKCTLTTPNGFVFLCTSLYFVNRPNHFGFETNEQDPGMHAVEATTKLNVWPRLFRATSTLIFFANSFGTLVFFKVDCKAEELTKGQHLVILMMDTSLEEDSQTSSTLRVYYEPPNSSTSEVRLLLGPADCFCFTLKRHTWMIYII